MEQGGSGNLFESLGECAENQVDVLKNTFNCSKILSILVKYFISAWNGKAKSAHKDV